MISTFGITQTREFSLPLGHSEGSDAEGFVKPLAIRGYGGYGDTLLNPQTLFGDRRATSPPIGDSVKRPHNREWPSGSITVYAPPPRPLTGEADRAVARRWGGRASFGLHIFCIDEIHMFAYYSNFDWLLAGSQLEDVNRSMRKVRGQLRRHMKAHASARTKGVAIPSETPMARLCDFAKPTAPNPCGRKSKTSPRTRPSQGAPKGVHKGVRKRAGISAKL